MLDLFKTIIVGTDINWVPNNMQIMLERLEKSIKLVIECLVEQVSLLGELKQGSGVIELPLILSRVVSARCTAALSFSGGGNILAIACGHSDYLVYRQF